MQLNLFIVDLFFSQESENPKTLCGKRQGNVPVLLVETDLCYLIVGSKIISEIDVEKLDEGVIALLASFYLLDFDYPRQQENGLLVLQHFLFNDTNVPQDATASFRSVMGQYTKYKAA